MKNLLCKHCAFIAAVFAVCLFVTSCDNPVNPGQKPNPEPAPSPAPQPAPAPSIEVPAPPQAPSAEGGATEQLPALPPVEESEEMESITVTLQSINTPSAPATYGVVPSYTTAQTVIVHVPKKLNDVTKRAEKVEEQLLYKLESEGYSGCVLCGANTGTGTPSAAALTGTGTVFVKQQPMSMKVQIRIQSITGDKTVTPAAPPGGAAVTYKPCTTEAFVNTIVFATVMNTDAAAAQQAALKAAVEHKVGAGYGCFTNAATDSSASLAADASFTDNGVIYVGKKQ